jgi:hypothetical protein
MANISIDGHVRNSQFVIAGQVVRLGATTMSMVTASPNAGIFRIEEILHGPRLLDGFANREITVLFKESSAVRAGASAIIFGTSWLYGESLAVVEVASMEPSERDVTRDEINAAYGRLADERLSERIARAELVVAGKVVKTEPAPEEIRRRMPITEHEPMWWIAEIEITGVEKGSHGSKRVNTFFPSSGDAAWHDSPKFAVGDKGIWILQRDQQERGWPRMRVPGLTALDPLDFQSPERRDLIRRLIRGGPGETPPR